MNRRRLHGAASFHSFSLGSFFKAILSVHRLEFAIFEWRPFLIFATVNALVRGSRKNAANCDTHCDVRNSEIRQVFERILYIEFYLMYI